MSETDCVQRRLANGLTVVVQPMADVPSVACGFLVRTGARDDPREMAGVSHFLEHMCFKGTERRNWHEISIAFDEMGSHYNAYTSKDRTFYYGWVRTEDFERQLEVLADMMRSTLPEDEFEMEKKVVLEEIAMSNDDLASNAYDFLYERVCADSPLAWPVLGYEETIEAMTRDQMADFYRMHYAANNLILIVAGDVEPGQVMAVVERCCGHWDSQEPPASRRPPIIHAGRTVSQLERFHQQAVLLAFPAASAVSELDETAEAVAAILGGPNSRFYWNIVQKGLATRAGAYREEYGDFGLMVAYALCEPDRCEKVLDGMREEIRRLVHEGPRDGEIQQVKNLRRMSLATESEAPFYRLAQIAVDVDYRDQPRTTQQRLAEVEAVSMETVTEYLRTFPLTGEGFLVGVGPRDWPSV